MTTTTMGSAGAGELRNRLATCNLADLGGQDQFLLRLQRETGWSRSFALGAITEYLRYCELCVQARGESLSPGPVIDQVWHQHLLETRHYWLHFCPQVLGQDLHHQPSRSGHADRVADHDRHVLTLRRYARTFGMSAPGSYWPQWRPGPRRPAVGAILTWAMLLVLLCSWPTSTLAADTDLHTLADWNQRWAGWLVPLLAVLLFVVRAALTEEGQALRDPDADLGVLAFARSGRWRAFDTAVIELLAGGHVFVDGHGQLRPGCPPGANVSPLARELYRAFSGLGSALPPLEHQLRPTWQALELRLREEQVLHPSDAEHCVGWLRLPWLFIGLLLVAGMVLGGNSHHVFLAFLCIPLAWLLGRRLGPTLATRRQLSAMAEAQPVKGLTSAELPRATALHSLRAVCAHPLVERYAELRRQHATSVETTLQACSGCSDTAACSSGCGGGDGGGCGGCGGCG